MPRHWTCQGCGTRNERIKQRCPICARKRPDSRPPAHMKVLETPYEETASQFDNVCGICGAPPKARRLHRDHEHSGAGKVRGLLCFRCNAALRPYMTADWLRRALAYLERAEA